MGEDAGADGGDGIGADGSDNRGSGSGVESAGLPFSVGGDDGGIDGGNSGGNGSGDGGGSGAASRKSGGSRAERSRGNKQAHATKTSRQKTEVKITERRSRATKTKPAIPPAPLGDLVAVCFAITAQRKGAHWQLAPEEKAAWGEALANVLVHVPMPEKQVGIVADIVAVGFVAYASIVPRMEADKALVAHAAEHPAVRLAEPAPVPFVAGA